MMFILCLILYSLVASLSTYLLYSKNFLYGPELRCEEAVALSIVWPFTWAAVILSKLLDIAEKP